MGISVTTPSMDARLYLDKEKLFYTQWDKIAWIIAVGYIYTIKINQVCQKEKDPSFVTVYMQDFLEF